MKSAAFLRFGNGGIQRGEKKVLRRFRETRL
jgi:hypothetical protein